MLSELRAMSCLGSRVEEDLGGLVEGAAGEAVGEGEERFAGEALGAIWGGEAAGAALEAAAMAAGLTKRRTQKIMERNRGAADDGSGGDFMAEAGRGLGLN